MIQVRTSAMSGAMRRDGLKTLRTLDVHSRAIDSNRQRRRFHRGKVIVAIRRGKDKLATGEHGFFLYTCVHLCNSWLKSAARGSPLAARFTRSLKIIVEHSSMTNQTHLFRQLDAGRPDQGATPRTEDVVHGWLFMVLKIDTLTQLDLPD